MSGTAARRNFNMQGVAADGKPGGIALIDEQVGEVGDDAAGVVDFRHALVGKTHRAGVIDDKIHAQVGIGLEFLDVIAI